MALRYRGTGHHAILRALAFKWLRILWRCWQTRQDYDQEKYLQQLEKRRSPIAAPRAPTGSRNGGLKSKITLNGTPQMLAHRWRPLRDPELPKGAPGPPFGEAKGSRHPSGLGGSVLPASGFAAAMHDGQDSDEILRGVPAVVRTYGKRRNT